MTGQPRWLSRNRIDLPVLLLPARPAGAVEAGATADAALALFSGLATRLTGGVGLAF